MKAWTYMATLSMLLLTACQQDTENWQPNERGFLLLESVTADVQHTTQADTRTVDPSFTVEILREDGSPVQTYAPGELTTQKIQLEAGTYQLKAYSANYKEVWPSGEKGEPKYYKEQPCTIKPNQLNRVSMAIPMSNTAISLQLPEGFQEWLPSYRFTVTQGNRHVTLLHGETLYVESHQTVGYTLSAENTDKEQHVASGKIDQPEANTHYEISYTLGTSSLLLSH